MHSATPQSKRTLEAIWRLEKVILDTLDFNDVVKKIVDSTITELGYLDLGYQIVVLCLVDTKNQVLRRISISETERAKQAIEKSSIPFHEINIPLSEDNNLLIRAIKTNEMQVCENWFDILRPAFSEEESKSLQRDLEIRNSVIFPVRHSNITIGALIFSMSKDDSEMGPEEIDLLRNFTDVVGLAVQNASIYTNLEKTKIQLENANNELKKLDSLKDEFLSMASHELKSPMNAVKNYLWMALHKGKEHPEKLDEYLTIAYESIQRLIALVNDLLDVSRIQSGRVTLDIKPLDLDKILRETIEIYSTQAKAKNLTLTIQQPTPIQVMADDLKIRDVLNNLVSNAIKYTPSGSITIAVTPLPSAVRISVIDTGMGISEQDQAKLFQKFSRVGTSFKEMAAIEGTGLGLYIAKQFIEMMNGCIGLESSVGKGTTFWIELPTDSKQLAANSSQQSAEQ